MDSKTTIGALFSPVSVPMTTSAVLRCLDIPSWDRVEVCKFGPILLRALLNFDKSLSYSVTSDPKDKAVRAASIPVVCAPITTVCIGGTPVILPKSKPLPLLEAESSSEAI